MQNHYDLSELDNKVEAALATGDKSQLDVLAYGEISVVLRLVTPTGDVACKRLPIFKDAAALGRYQSCFDRYLIALGDAGVRVVSSELCVVDRADGTRAAYCVQPLLAADTLAPRVLKHCHRDEAIALFDSVVDVVLGCVTERVGLDAQLSNWTYVDGKLTYLDVTTPLLRDRFGHNLLDTDLFLAALPRPLRAAVKRWLLSDITDKYHQPRGVIMDVIANLHKEQLAHWIPSFVTTANRSVNPPMTAAEVRRYYKSDARIWGALLWLRHADRAWHRRVLHRPYPFLLPRRIDRYV